MKIKQAILTGFMERLKDRFCEYPEVKTPEEKIAAVAQTGLTGAIIGPRNLKQFKNLLFSVNMKLNGFDLEFCDQ